MRKILLVLNLGWSILGQTPPHPMGNRTTPPIIRSISPRGVARGVTTELTIEGLNLANTRAIYFSDPGVKGRIANVKELADVPEPVQLGAGGLPSSIDLGPLPPRNQVTVELDVAADADIGPVAFRLWTPLGTTSEVKLLVEPFYGESPDREPNDGFEAAFETYTPTILVGTISRPGDTDYYKLQAKAGEQLVFEDGAQILGSALDPVITIFTADQSIAAEYSLQTMSGVRSAVHQFQKSAWYYIRISDRQLSGSTNHFYRIKVGKFPLVTSVSPAGVKRGATTEISVDGFYIEPKRIQVTGELSTGSEDHVTLRPSTRLGKVFNSVKLAIGDDPEVQSSGDNLSAGSAQKISLPVTINGRIDMGHGGRESANYFRFSAKKGEKVIIEVNAARLGSALDSVIEVLDAAGNPIERATLRAVRETLTSILERDASTPGIFLSSLAGLAVGDYVMIGDEILKIEQIPAQACLVVTFASFEGQRLTYLDTTSEEHGLDKPAYKVLVYLPGEQFENNGLPVRRLYFRNDDGGPGFGKDSRLHFTAAATGDYVLRIRDIRELGGPTYQYRLTVRHPRPDFRLSVSPKNPNVPAGGAIPVTVSAFRIDDFDGLIRVSMAFPPG